MESKLWLADFPREYYVAATKALLKARPVESAVDDLLERILRDLPTDLNGYIESQRAALSSYFEPSAPTEPQTPSRDSPEYDAWFLGTLEERAGREAPAPESKAAAGGTEPPKVIAWEDTAGRLAHVEAIAHNEIQVADPVR